MNYFEQYFHQIPFMILYKVVVTINSVKNPIIRNNSNIMITTTTISQFKFSSEYVHIDETRVTTKNHRFS